MLNESLSFIHITTEIFPPLPSPCLSLSSPHSGCQCVCVCLIVGFSFHLIARVSTGVRVRECACVGPQACVFVRGVYGRTSRGV